LCRQHQSELKSYHEDDEAAKARYEESCTKLRVQVVDLESKSIEHEKLIIEVVSFLQGEQDRARSLLSSDGEGAETADGEEHAISSEASITKLMSTLTRLNAEVREEVESLRKKCDLASLTNDELQVACDEQRKLLEKTQHQQAEEKEDLNAKLGKFEKELETAQAAVAHLAEKLSKADEKAKDLSSVNSKALNAEIERRKSAETELEGLRREKKSLETERDRLEGMIQDLEHELRQADEALQIHITNEVTDKATTMAAEALRQQMDEIRNQSEEDHRALQEEQEARLAAEDEARRLRSDLAALLGLEDSEEAQSEVRLHAVRATEDLQRKERDEIEDLKAALHRARNELAEIRDEEAKADKLASNAAFQIAMYEQEIVTARSDLKLLTDSIGEIREAEAVKREAMDYRISSLLSEQNDLKRTYAAEVGNLKNELHQLRLERDRLFQSLKESERSKDALMRAGAGRDTSDDAVKEIAKLRMEKTELITQLSEERTRAERRIREARAADKSSAEADVILERESRIAKEQALEYAKIEIEELRAEVEAFCASRQDDKTVTSLQEDRDHLTDQVESLSVEILSLRKELDQSKNEARQKIERLTLECKQAKTRVHQLEGQVRVQTDVHLDIARLRVDSPYSEASINTAEENPAEDGRDEARVARLYDEIHKLEKAIKHDHLLYKNLLDQQDQLFAILAQKELMRECLNDVLLRHGGQQAVDTAMREADERSLELYGHPISSS